MVEIPVVMLSNDVVSVLGGGLDEKVSEEDVVWRSHTHTHKAEGLVTAPYIYYQF